MPRLQIALDQLQFTRGFINSLLADIEENQWFTFPGSAATHLGWQLGHLAASNFLETKFDKPIKIHPAFSTLFGSMIFAGQHELIHAGQIALLRRLFGNECVI